MLVAGVSCLAIAAAAALGTGTYAGWSAGDAFRGGKVSAGDLKLTTGTPTWRQVTPGVSAPASGTLSATPPDFVSMPGDVIEVRVPLTSYLQGDNLAAELWVRSSDRDAISSDIKASVHIEDDAGQQVVPETGNAPYDDRLTLTGLVGSDAGRTQEWVAVVVVEVLGDYVWHKSADQVPSWWTVGDLDVGIDQVRAGAGFTDAGAP